MGPRVFGFVLSCAHMSCKLGKCRHGRTGGGGGGEGGWLVKLMPFGALGFQSRFVHGLFSKLGSLFGSPK